MFLKAAFEDPLDEVEFLRGQLRTMGAANVRLILQRNNDAKAIKSLQNEVQGATKDLVSQIICNSKLAADNEELASTNAVLKAEISSIKLV